MPIDMPYRQVYGSTALGEDPLAEITGVVVLEAAPWTWVDIGVVGGAQPIVEVRLEQDSSAYEVIVWDSEGNLTTWMWEFHKGTLVSGENRNGPDTPRAAVLFTNDSVRFQLPEGTDVKRIEVRTFSNPTMAKGEDGPKFVDRATVDVASQRAG